MRKANTNGTYKKDRTSFETDKLRIKPQMLETQRNVLRIYYGPAGLYSYVGKRKLAAREWSFASGVDRRGRGRVSILRETDMGRTWRG